MRRSWLKPSGGNTASATEKSSTITEGAARYPIIFVKKPGPYRLGAYGSERSIHGTELPVSVFTDGFRHEFDQLFKLNNIILIEGNSDLEDLLLLSKSKIIVTSASSTFSYWAGFLSDACLIMHPDHVNTLIRPENDSHELYEGDLDPTNSLLVESIKKIN